jgi:hypothetical protein
MQCACKRWGPGTTCEKPIDSQNAKDLEAKMKEIMAEREKQNNFWTSTTQTMTIKAETNNVTSSAPQEIRFWN